MAEWPPQYPRQGLGLVKALALVRDPLEEPLSQEVLCSAIDKYARICILLTYYGSHKRRLLMNFQPRNFYIYIHAFNSHANNV